jgi:hypothetical protein
MMVFMELSSSEESNGWNGLGRERNRMTHALGYQGLFEMQ